MPILPGPHSGYDRKRREMCGVIKQSGSREECTSDRATSLEVGACPDVIVGCAVREADIASRGEAEESQVQIDTNRSVSACADHVHRLRRQLS